MAGLKLLLINAFSEKYIPISRNTILDAIKILFLTNNKTHYAITCGHRYIRHTGSMGGMEINGSNRCGMEKLDFFQVRVCLILFHYQ